MFYSATPPNLWGDRVHFYPSFAAARAAGAGRPVLAVAIRFDGRSRIVAPLWTDEREFDASWTSPAQALPDGSILVRGPIPEPLLIPVDPDAPDLEPRTVAPRGGPSPCVPQ